MKRDLPAYIYNKKGVLYFQRRGLPTVRVEHAPGTKEFALEYARLLNGPEAPVIRGRTFDDLCRSYERSPRYRKLAERTRRDYDKVIAWVRDKLGALPVEGYRRKDAIRARDANADTVRFANYTVQVTRILFEHAIDLGWRDDNPVKGVSLLKSETKPREAWPTPMVEKFRKAAPPRARLIFELCLQTGQRIGDVLKMRWDDIEDGGIKVSQGKTGVRLWIPMTQNLRSVLDRTPRIGLTICAWGDHGRPLKYRTAHEAVIAVRREIGAEDYDLHGLRYTACAELGALGLDDDMIMAVSGHTTKAMVAKYAGPARQKARAKIAQSMRDKSDI
ncbi:tyrosine-type recombinase/integrase [Thioclava sp. GXIMD2076]|uniref:tyrosine-type recombinase/integrase n=1 Tax=Thioclava sp. GXIMD2076 TaxID=3131931 RepID=UPI0030CF1937